MYKTTDADVTLFLKHFSSYFLMVERSGKALEDDVCRSVADIFLGRYGAECTPVKLLCYFANYSGFKGSFREFDPEDIIVQYANKFQPWWGGQMAKYYNDGRATVVEEPLSNSVDSLKICVRRWIENGEDPREKNLYRLFHIVTDELIEEVQNDISSGVF